MKPIHFVSIITLSRGYIAVDACIEIFVDISLFLAPTFGKALTLRSVAQWLAQKRNFNDFVNLTVPLAPPENWRWGNAVPPCSPLL